MVVFPNCWVSLCRRRAHRKRADDEPPFMLFVRRVNPLWGKSAHERDSARCPLLTQSGHKQEAGLGAVAKPVRPAVSVSKLQGERALALPHLPTERLPLTADFPNYPAD
jgi:hypothetical protein